MKKFFIVILVICLAALSACGKPKDMTTGVYNLGIEALDVTDQYLDGEMLAEDSIDKLDDIYSELDKWDDDGTSVDLFVTINVGNVKWAIQEVQFDDATKDDVLVERNGLADNLGKRKK